MKTQTIQALFLCLLFFSQNSSAILPGNPLNQAILAHDTARIRTLAEKGARLNAPDQEGLPPLLHAISTQHAGTIQTLLELGAHPDGIGTAHSGPESWFSPLHLAVYEGNEMIVRMLLQYHANVNLQTPDGSTPLHLACIQNNLPVVKILLEHGAMINHINHSGSSPLHLAAGNAQGNLVQYLLEHGANPNLFTPSNQTPLHAAIISRDLESVLLLLAYGALIDGPPEARVPPLFLLCRNSDPDTLSIARFLIQSGADVNKTEPRHGNTALHYAARWNNRHMIELLLHAGADPHRPNNAGKTPPELATTAETTAAFTHNTQNLKKYMPTK